MCDEYGADALRLYELFMGPLEEGASGRPTACRAAGGSSTGPGACRRRRGVGPRPAKLVDGDGDRPELRDVERALHQAIKRVTEAVDNLRINTAIADMMVFVNEATKAGEGAARRGSRRS
jgi:leucyl-tRNA synthetase